MSNSIYCLALQLNKKDLAQMLHTFTKVELVCHNCDKVPCVIAQPNNWQTMLGIGVVI